MSNLLGRIRSGVGNLFSNPNNASVSDVLSSPLFSAGMGLLQAGQDSRINPISAVRQGLLSSEQMRLAQEEERRRKMQRLAIDDYIDALPPSRYVAQMGPPTPDRLVQMGPPTEDGMYETQARSGSLNPEPRTRPNPMGSLLRAMEPSEAASTILSNQMSLLASGGAETIGSPMRYVDESGDVRIGVVKQDTSSGRTYMSPVADAQVDIRGPLLDQQINDSNEWQTATANAVEASRLLESFKAMEQEEGGIPSGWFAQAGEFWKNFTGSQDDFSELRRRQRSITTRLAISSLPPGVASDKDIELVFATVPDNFANAEQVKSYLRSLARGQKKLAHYFKFRSNYIESKKKIGGVIDAYESELSRIKKEDPLSDLVRRN